MPKAQVHLTREQLQKLRALARERGLTLDDLLQEGIEKVIEQADRKARWARAWEVVGAFHDPAGTKDVSQRHDEYLTKEDAGGDRLR